MDFLDEVKEETHADRLEVEITVHLHLNEKFSWHNFCS